MVLSLIGIGSVVGMPRELVIIGVPLLSLGMALSTYLGLMVTRGVRWPEGVTGALVMLALMAIALQAGSQTTMSRGASIAILIGLATLAVILRQAARERWRRIDWSQCRVDRDAEARAGSWT